MKGQTPRTYGLAVNAEGSFSVIKFKEDAQSGIGALNEE